MGCQPPVSYSNSKDVGELAEPLRSRVHTMILDAPDAGLILVSGYRTPWMQWLLRHERCPGRECDSGCQGSPLTALPGRSEHQKRRAADLGGRAMLWAHANCELYGTNAEVVPSENWHHEAAGEPSIRIIPWPHRETPDPEIGHEWIGLSPGDTDWTVFSRGGLTNEVSEIQWRLNSLAGRIQRPDMNSGVGDGIYGSKTQHAAMVFKVWIIRMQRSQGVPRDKQWSPHITPQIGEKFINMLTWWTP